MNKTTYANFYGVVNVCLGGCCVNSALNVFGMGVFTLPEALWATILSCSNYASNDLQSVTGRSVRNPDFHP